MADSPLPDEHGEGAPPVLRLARNRDAYPTIRGFVYQVELTILRWLRLGDQEALELESGEDIDRVMQRLRTGGEKDIDRLLEQVKHRERRLTLRSGAVRSALANFHEHRRLNPDLALHFRFTTNAHPGQERSNPIPGKMAGLAAWQGFHSGGLGGQDTASVLEALRQILLAGKRPTDVTADSWKAWRKFVRSAAPDEFLGFIRQVEIATGEASPDSLAPAIQHLLLDHGHAADEEAAERLYHILFVAVFKRLTAPGRKVLTREDLLAEAAGVGVGSSDERLLATLRPLLTSLADRLDQVQVDVEAMRTEMGEMREGVSALSAEVVAGRMPPGARAGDTRTFQTTTNYFGRELSPTPTFNHSRPLLDRQEILRDGRAALQMTHTDEPRVVVVAGRGGVGKSRVILELARQAEESGEYTVFWVRDREKPDAQSLNELPDGPVAIFCDDAHRRSDLAAVLGLAEDRRNPTVVVLGIRPHGKDSVRSAAFRAGIGREQIINLPELEDLPAKELTELVARELDPAERDLAQSIVKVVHGSTLVALVAARLLRERRLSPGMLAQDPEVHHVVFTGFEDEIYGEVSRDVDPAHARKVLELLAAISPIQLTDSGAVERYARFVGLEAPDFLRAVGALQEAGVLRDHRTGLRIIPDVLSDHILQRTLVAAGRPTHYEMRIMEDLGDNVLPNLLRNVADLDWQLSVAAEESGTGGGIDLLSLLWMRFDEAFQAASNYQRRMYLERLQPVAAYQPRRVLELCEWVADHPENPVGTPPEEAWQPSSVLERVTPLLALVAYHEDQYVRVLDLLWRLGRDDARALNPYPEHAIRTLEEVVRYAPRRYVWRQERAAEALKRWTAEDGWSRSAHSPLVVARAILSTSMVEDRFDPTGGTVTMTRYGVDAGTTRPARLGVVELLGQLAIGPEPRGRVWAAQALLDALAPPDSQFGHVVTDEEEESFREQYEAAFDVIAMISQDSGDPLVRVMLHDGLQWASRRTTLAWKRESARDLARRFRETNATKFVRAWGRMFRDAYSSWEEREKRGDAITDQVADRLSASLGGAPAVIKRLVEMQQRFAAAGVDQQPSYVLSRLAEKRDDLAVEIASWVICSEATEVGAVFAFWLHTLLLPLRRLQPTAYAGLIAAAATSSRADLRRGAALTLRWTHAENPWDEEERFHVRSLLQDSDETVRAAAVGALFALPAQERGEYLREVQVGGSTAVAGAVADHWAYRRSAEQPTLDSGSVQQLMEMLIEVPDIGGQTHIDKMLGVLAKSEPLGVLDLVISRVRREAESWARRTFWGRREYDAVPYHGLRAVWAALQTSSEHPTIVRRLLRAMADEAKADPQWHHEALKVATSVMRWDPEVERALSEWMADGRCDDIVALEAWFASQPPLFVIEHPAFVERLITWLAESDCTGRDTVEAALCRSAAGGMRMRYGGQPNEVDRRLANEASSVLADCALDPASPAGRFFATIRAEAEQRQLTERARDEEVEDLAAMLEDEYD